MKTGWRDAYRSFYYETLPSLPEPCLPSRDTVLLVIDLQAAYLVDKEPADDRAAAEWRRWAPFRERMHGQVLPNTRRLLSHFRDAGSDVIFVRIACLRSDGRDRSLSQARPGFNNLLLPAWAPESQILPEVAPLAHEVVLTKTTDSALTGTSLRLLLNNLGTRHVVVCGVFTDQCVASTVRSLADENFDVVVVDDACAAGTDELHRAELTILNNIYCQVLSCDETLAAVHGPDSEKTKSMSPLIASLVNADKAAVLRDSAKFWNPNKVETWAASGVDLVIGRREGYHLYDMSGHRLIDMHLNGGTYNLGHRNPEIIAELKEAMDYFDVGNHHFPSIARTALSKRLVQTAPANMRYAVLASGGGEAIDIGLKCARYATKRRKIISVIRAYHGHTGLALGTADGRYAKQFLSEGSPEEFVKVPFNDLPAMEAALRHKDAACVIMETIPATYGFPMPADGYLAGVKDLCHKYGSVYVADEVQTGLMRCGGGHLWGISSYGVQPDIIVTSKGLSGGLYPIGAVIVNEQAGGWLREDGWGHISTFGGSELGCVAALKTLEITLRPETIANVDAIAQRLRAGLERIQADNSKIFTGIRQRGVIFGLEFRTVAEGAKPVMRELYKTGVWAIYSQLDPCVLQYKAGLLLTPTECDELLERTAAGIRAASLS